MTMEKALIAMSGGVDSSVAAHLTIQEGIPAMGAIMLLHQEKNVSCSTADSVDDARNVAQRLGIPFHVFPLTETFASVVIDNFISCYEAGLTPNPCVQCNRHMKFSLFLEKADSLDCRWIVTGHYARILRDPDTGRYLLAKAVDTQKDQSYFLYPLTQQQLARIRFPLGELTKDQVRRIAQDNGFLNAKKKDSQDICFVPDGDYMAFLRRYTGKEYPKGNYLDLRGNVLGRHNGAVGYTLGQRKGLGLSVGQPVYVCAKDMEKNTVTVGPNEALFHKTLRANDWFFFPFDAPTQPIRVKAKARSRMVEQDATVYPEENGFCRVVFDEPQRAITPGQAVVLYDGDIVVGGGTITEVLQEQ